MNKNILMRQNVKIIHPMKKILHQKKGAGIKML